VQYTIPKALIFDMDGTMVDNMMVHHKAWQEQLAIEGLPLSLAEVIAVCHGKNLEILERLFGNKYTAAQRLAISNAKEAKYRAIFGKTLCALPGLESLLKSAQKRGIAIGMGTAAQYANVDFVLDGLNLRPYFTTIVADIDVLHGKPHPEVFLKVAAQLGVAPSQCLVFEDSPVGAMAAKNAGMPTVILATTHKLEEFSGFENVVHIMKNYENFDLDNFKKQQENA
jgi:beta-phosphoglucomutase